MLNPKGSESMCIVMRSLLHFLGLSSSPNPSAGTFELGLAKEYKYHCLLAKMRNPGNYEITYEIKADNLGGESFDDKSLARYKADYPGKVELLAKFHHGVHVHTAHLTWGANHSVNCAIWDINNEEANREVVEEICNLLQERVYKKTGRQVPWDEGYNYTGSCD
jgi:hypothetical protein